MAAKIKYHKFFSRKAGEVARDILGRIIIRETEKGITAGRITETAAYEGGRETNQRKGMKYASGTVFLMPFRGHYFLNIATDRRGFASCVEIREVAFYDKTVTGSGAVASHLGIGKDLDGVVLGEELQVIGEPAESSRVKITKKGSENCLGYFSIK